GPEALGAEGLDLGPYGVRGAEPHQGARRVVARVRSRRSGALPHRDDRVRTVDHRDVRGEGRQRQGAVPQEDRRRAGDADEGGFEADPGGRGGGGRAVEDQVDAVAQALVHVVGGGGGDGGGSVGAGGGDGEARRTKQRQRDRVGRDPHGHRRTE